MYVSFADILEFGDIADAPCSESFSAGYKLVAYCERDSNREERPHEILGEISPSGKIRRMACDCGSENAQCQHVFAVLLYCNRHNLDRLQFVSEEEVLSMHIEDFAPKPLLEYKSFAEKFKSSSGICLTEEQEAMIREKLCGYHFEPVVIKEEQE